MGIFTSLTSPIHKIRSRLLLRPGMCRSGLTPGGATYSRPSLPKGSYRVTAASDWIVDWTALGYSGSLPMTMTGERDLLVGELHSLTVAR